MPFNFPFITLLEFQHVDWERWGTPNHYEEKSTSSLLCHPVPFLLPATAYSSCFPHYYSASLRFTICNLWAGVYQQYCELVGMKAPNWICSAVSDIKTNKKVQSLYASLYVKTQSSQLRKVDQHGSRYGTVLHLALSSMAIALTAHKVEQLTEGKNHDFSPGFHFMLCTSGQV